LLKDTQLSIYEIATAMGYSSDKHLARYFKRQMGMSPLAYRKKLNNHDL
jgi:AraC family transcriptional regulator